MSQPAYRIRSLACAALLLSLSVMGCGDSAKGSGKGLQTNDPQVPFLPAVEGFVNAPPNRIRLTDRTGVSGFNQINHSGRAGVKEILMEAVGPGPAILDYDNDGFMDVFIPDGDELGNYELKQVGDPKSRALRPYLERKTERVATHYDQLWRNNGDGTFTDVAEQVGIRDDRWSFGATTFDYDGDGDTDIFVASFGRDRLWRNNGNGTFTDVAAEVGVDGEAHVWSTCAAVGDVDDDGRLEIYVAAYADSAFEMNRQRVRNGLDWNVSAASIHGRSCRWRGLEAYCGPLGLEGQHDRLLRAEDDGTFRDVTSSWGLTTSLPQYGFTTAMFDFNDDGLLDIYVANDSVENFMWQQFRRKDGSLFFRDTADTLSVKYGHGLNAQASMGMAISDVDHDGILDILVTNFSHDYNNIFKGKRVNATGGFFYKDRGLKVMGTPVYLDLSWGCGWVDFDNDADSDLFIANGHVYAEIDSFARLESKYKQLNALFECIDAGDMAYREIGAKALRNLPKDVKPDDIYAGTGMEVRQCSRAATFADFDNDGKMDVLVGNLNDLPTLLMNTSDVDGHWVKIVLSQSDANTEGVGATVSVETPDGHKQRVPVLKCASFLGTNDARMHFGLGAHTSCKVTVVWPGRARDTSTFELVAVDGLWVLDRDSGEATQKPMPQWKR